MKLETKFLGHEIMGISYRSGGVSDDKTWAGGWLNIKFKDLTLVASVSRNVGYTLQVPLENQEELFIEFCREKGLDCLGEWVHLVNDTLTIISQENWELKFGEDALIFGEDFAQEELTEESLRKFLRIEGNV